ncbi:MAG TPA: DUF4097 family beta strand repeat-containing protein [Candidatus Polarisedimenticolia bacterium]|nr:DUF4097 family beta strand repeat-containing protein [Candidatus Polarisedimenticolia bacterium]
MRKIGHVRYLIPLLLILVGMSASPADTTRTLRREMPPGARFAVENLAGSMRVTAGSGSQVVVTATVHAETEEAAGLLSLEQVTGKEGVPTLRVVYPTSQHTRYRYPKRSDGGFLSGLFGSSSTTTEYAGDRVKISSKEGLLLYADVEVQVPGGAEGTFRNLVGDITGGGVEGNSSFEAASANVTLEGLRGKVAAATGSGDVNASSMEGGFKGATGSGNITLVELEGDSVSCSTGSGNVRIESSKAQSVEASTGSGNIKVVGGDLEEFSGSTGSGNVDVEADGGRIASLEAATGSGNVLLRLGPDASFEAMTETGSGDVVSRYDDAEPIMKNREVIGYRRGGSRSRIKVSTGSGNVVLEPGT